MEKEFIRYIGFRNDNVTGPCVETKEECILSLVVGYKRTTGNMKLKWDAWNFLKKNGYSVKKCKVIPIEE